MVPNRCVIGPEGARSGDGPRAKENGMGVKRSSVARRSHATTSATSEWKNALRFHRSPWPRGA